MLTLYHAPRSRSFRILWLLEELGVPYETNIVAIRRGDGSGQEEGGGYRQVHPHAKVPALVHDGVPVFETPAIALYLTDAFPEAGLGPRVGDPARGPYLSWLSYSTGVLEPALMSKFLKLQHIHGTFGWGPYDDVVNYLRRSLEASPYLLGQTFSAADIVVGGSMPLLMSRGLLPQDEPFKSYTARITERDGFRAAQAKDNG
jgi:glutathione S-transferase